MAALHPTKTVTIRGEAAPITNGYRFKKAAPTREERGRLIADAGMVHPVTGIFYVRSATGRLRGAPQTGHWVNAIAGTCDCGDFIWRSELPGYTGCQHLAAVRAYLRDVRAELEADADLAAWHARLDQLEREVMP